jgi:hypothetical protein
VRPFLANPTSFLRAQRERLGDTFLLRVAGFDLFCVFGPLGLRSLYVRVAGVAALDRRDAEGAGATRPPPGGRAPRRDPGDARSRAAA